MSKRNLAVSYAVCVGMLGAAQAFAADSESTTIGGRMFADFSYIDQKANNGTGDVKTDASGVGTDVKRFYIIVTHKFDDIWSANVTTDFNYTSSSNYATVFIKKAYLQATVSDALVGRLGSHDLPWVPYVDDLYGYRYVEKVIIDRLGFGTSADWGLNGNGKLADGQLNYSVSALNGNGYRNATRSKSVDVEGRLGFSPLPGLTLAAGFYTGKRGQYKESTNPANTANRFDALVAFVNPSWRLGAEYFAAKNWSPTNITGPAEDKADGWSAWAAYNFDPKWSIFARADQAKPSKNLSPALKEHYYNAGLAWHARKGVDLSFVVKRDKVEHGTFAVSNGATNTATSTTGGFNNLVGGSVEGTYTEAGVFALVSF